MDVVVTVPKTEWAAWLGEGDLAGNDRPDALAVVEYGFIIPRLPERLCNGDRVYVVAHGHLRGYAPLRRVGYGSEFGGRVGSWALVRGGGAVAVTIPATGPPERIMGFRGFRYRWWEREDEIVFPDWQTAGVK